MMILYSNTQAQCHMYHKAQNWSFYICTRGRLPIIHTHVDQRAIHHAAKLFYTMQCWGTTTDTIMTIIASDSETIILSMQ